VLLMLDVNDVTRAGPRKMSIVTSRRIATAEGGRRRWSGTA